MLFHSVLDTVEVLGSDDFDFCEIRLISREASEEAGNHALKLEFCDEDDDGSMPFF